MVPPELLELTLCFYSSNSSNASEERVNTQFPQHSPECRYFNDYLMKSVSRNWSRPTNDFIVRYREKRS
jgi:hypothetical protein